MPCEALARAPAVPGEPTQDASAALPQPAGQHDISTTYIYLHTEGLHPPDRHTLPVARPVGQQVQLPGRTIVILPPCQYQPSRPGLCPHSPPSPQTPRPIPGTPLT